MNPTTQQSPEPETLSSFQRLFSKQQLRELPVLKILIGTLGIFLIVGVSGVSYLLQNQHQQKTTPAKRSPQLPAAKSAAGTQPIALQSTKRPIIIAPTTVPFSITKSETGVNTYTSYVEKARFTFPQNWIVTKPSIETGIPGVDQIGIQSPSGAVTVSWISSLSGFGGGCDPKAPLGSAAGCAESTVIDTTPVKNASGLYVVSGIITSDDVVYEPYMAVQDSKNSDLMHTGRTMGYDMYLGRHNGSLSANHGKNTMVLFSTGNTYASGPNLTLSEARAWFNKPEVQQAKQILLSLTY